MKSLNWLSAAALCLGVSGSVASAQNGISLDQTWFALDAMPQDVQAGEEWIRPAKGQPLMLDEQRMMDVLKAAPLERTGADPIIVWLPRPDGIFERFLVEEAPIWVADFQAQHPEFRTYIARGMDDVYATARLDHTPMGFHAQILSPHGAYYIDPFTRDNNAYYTSYYKRDYVRHAGVQWQCGVTAAAPNVDEPADNPFGQRAAVTLRTYRLALACTGEYTAFFAQAGDSDAQKIARAQAAMTTSINRVTGVYETELGIRLSLINNTSIIYVNSATDPYTNNNGSTMLGQNQTNLDSVIGNANYDIGHVFSTGGGGIAGLGVVCRTSNKARGVTGSPAPRFDAFDIDYVAHEMGHQFNAPHTFNSCGGAGDGQRYEPGSGSTIMAYAGICGSDDLQAHSDPFFHHTSLSTIFSYVTAGSGTCSSNSATGNNTPSVNNGGTTSTIPKQTPFFLTATLGTDQDGDAITYSWEERDLGAGGAVTLADNGANPLWRCRVPSSSPTRYFPAFDDVLDGTNDVGEIFPNSNRTMNFRVTARDNRAGGGGYFITSTSRAVVVTTAAGPFLVTSPNTAIQVPAGAFTVTWSVASTDLAPVNCTAVDILCSTDGGATFPHVLATGTPNDGSESITLPNIQTNTARIMVRASSNIFFDVSNVNFRINAQALPNTPTNVQANPTQVCAGGTTILTATVNGGETVDWYAGSCGGVFVGTGSPLPVVLNFDATFFARARRIADNAVSANCGSVSVTILPGPTAPTLASSDRDGFCPSDAGNISLSATGGSGTTLRWFTGSCGGTQIGTGNPLVIASPTSTTTYFARWENACGNSSCASVTVNVAAGPTAPTSASSDRDNFCPTDAGSISLSASGGGGGTLKWYTGSCGGTLVGSGSPLVIDSPESTTTYYARYENACGNSACTSVTVNVRAGSDFNGDGFLDFFDLDAFVACFEGIECPPGKDADYNGDGFVDFFDLDEFIFDFEAGC